MQNERDSFDIRAIEHKGLGVISKDSNIYLNLLNLLRHLLFLKHNCHVKFIKKTGKRFLNTTYVV